MVTSILDHALVTENSSTDGHFSRYVYTHYLTACVTLLRPSSVVPLSSHTTVLRRGGGRADVRNILTTGVCTLFQAPLNM